MGLSNTPEFLPRDCSATDDAVCTTDWWLQLDHRHDMPRFALKFLSGDCSATDDAVCTTDRWIDYGHGLRMASFTFRAYKEPFDAVMA